MNKSGIYQILNKINGKSYIGSAVDIAERWRNHLCELRNNKHCNPYLQFAWNKYGEEAFKFNILEYVSNKEWLVEIEQYWIDFLEVANKDFGYNIRFIAENNSGLKHTEESRIKMSEAKKGKKRTFTEEHKKKLSESGKGRKHSEETKKKLSEINRLNQYTFGYKHTEEAKRKISEANKGNKNNLGYKHTEESKTKMSEAHIGKKGNQYWLGKKHTEDTKRKMSENTIERKRDLEGKFM